MIGNSRLSRTLAGLAGVALLAVATSGCAPEVGSERWCKMMNEKPKGEWSANDAGDYAKHCVLKIGE